MVLKPPSLLSSSGNLAHHSCVWRDIVSVIVTAPCIPIACPFFFFFSPTAAAFQGKKPTNVIMFRKNNNSFSHPAHTLTPLWELLDVYVPPWRSCEVRFKTLRWLKVRIKKKKAVFWRRCLLAEGDFLMGKKKEQRSDFGRVGQGILCKHLFLYHDSFKFQTLIGRKLFGCKSHVPAHSQYRFYILRALTFF